MFDDVLSISMTQDKPGRKQWRSNSGDSGVPKSDGRSQIPASVDTIGMAVLLKLLGQRLQRVTGCQDLMGWCSHSLPVVNVTWIGVIQISKMIQNTIHPASQPASRPSIHPSVHPSIYLHLMKSWDWYQLDTLWQDGHCLSTTNPWTREFLGHAWTCLDHSALGRANGWLSLCLVMHVGSSDHSSAIAWFGIPRLLTPCVWAVDIIAYIVPRWWLKRAGPGFQPGICRMQLHFQHVSTRGGQWWKPLYQYVQIPSRRRWCCIWLRPSVAPEFDLLLRPLHWRARWTAAASCHSQLDVFLYICACINLLIYLFVYLNVYITCIYI